MRWFAQSATDDPAPTIETLTPPIETPPAPGESVPTATPGPQPLPGGTVVELVARPADLLNPILTTNRTSLAAAAKLYPALLGQDPHTGAVVPTGMATAWTGLAGWPGLYV